MLTILTKQAMLTAVIYVALAFVGQFSLTVFARFKGPIGISLDRFPLGVLFGLAWLLSFNLAWRILRPNS